MEFEWITLDWAKDPDGWVDTFDDEHNQALSEAAWKPGNLIRLEDGKVHLIGTVNKNTGTCGCCNINRYDAVAYATPYPELLALLAR